MAVIKFGALDAHSLYSLGEKIHSFVLERLGRIKVLPARFLKVVFAALGIVGLRYIEGMGWGHSVYTSVMSVITVEYGDRILMAIIRRLYTAICSFVAIVSFPFARAFSYLDKTFEALVDATDYVPKREVRKLIIKAILRAHDERREINVTDFERLVKEIKEINA